MSRRPPPLRAVALAACIAASAASRAQPAPPATGRLVEGVATASDPTQTYTLYLPSTYDAQRSWPLLLVLDPRGRSVLAAEVFREAAERHGWILISSNDTRSDSGWEPNRRALAALWPEAQRRYASDPARIYAAGFSGTVIAAWSLALGTNGVAGIISSCGRLESDHRGRLVPFAQYSATGTEDFNYLPTLDMDAHLERAGATHKLSVFAGRHAWMPKELASQAIEWLEAVAMQRGQRPRDEILARQLYERELERAEAARMSGDLLSAAAALRSITAAFRDTLPGAAEDAAARAAAIAASSAYQRAEREAREARAFEEGHIARSQQAIAEWSGADPRPPAGALVSSLGLAALRKQAEASGPKGDAARRVLAKHGVQLGFYLPREFQAQRQWSAAATLLETAAYLQPGDATTLYNLACAQALAGDKKRALATLGKSVEAGYADAKHMLADPDLASLRELEGFRELVEKLGGA